MTFHRAILSILLLALVAACGGTQQARFTSQAFASAPPPAQPKQEPKERAPTVADAARGCDAIQQSRELPVGCKVTYLEGTLSMLLSVPPNEQGVAYARSLAQHIVSPFCSAANATNRRAAVLIGAGETLVGRYECETGEWVEAQQPSRKAELEAALGNCQSIQQSSSPVGCSVADVNGVASVMLGFGSEEDARRYLGSVTQTVAVPFCDALVDADQSADVWLVIAQTRARRYHCNTATWSDWMQLRPQTSPAPPSHQTPRPARPRYESFART